MGSLAAHSDYLIRDSFAARKWHFGFDYIFCELSMCNMRKKDWPCAPLMGGRGD